MAKVKIQGHASGTGVLTVTAPNTSTDRTITLPDGDVTLGGAVGGASGVDFNDDVKARFGTGNDLELYHNGSNSIIKNSTGITKIQADDIRIQSADDSESLAKFVKDGGAELYHNDSKKLETTATGIAVTGGVAIGGTAAANTLDDYEEGTHTPTITMGSGTATFYSSNNTLAYTKIGRVVHISGQVRIENTNSASGSFQISMPFTVLSGNAGLSAGNYRTYNVDTPDAGVQAVIYSEGGQAKATLEWSRDSIGSTEERATANGYYLIGLTYFV